MQQFHILLEAYEKMQMHLNYRMQVRGTVLLEGMRITV